MEKYRRNCHDQRKRFSWLVLSVDGIMGKGAQVVLSTLSQLMATKMEEPILHIEGLVNGRIKIAVAR